MSLIVPAEAFFDQFVRVHEAKAHLFGDDATDGGFARTHESDQRDVVDGSHVAHCLVNLPATSPPGTQFLSRRFCRGRVPFLILILILPPAFED